MSLDFTVVINVRQRFGDNKGDSERLEAQAPFQGLQRDYEFVCPKVDSSQTAVLLFQTMGVDLNINILQVNGQRVFGGIPVGGSDRDHLTRVDHTGNVPPSTLDLSRSVWNANVMLITPRVLRESNVLHIESVPNDDGNADDFIVDNVVVLFKTRVSNTPGDVFNG